MQRTRRRTRWLLAFSLTEIMAVSAIVTSIPAAQYARAKQKAHERTCAHNLREIGKMIIMYHQDAGHYPKASFFPENATEDESSIVRILADAGYAVPGEMWQCPAAPPALAHRGLTFVYNEKLGGRRSLKSPSRAWLLVEINCVSRSVAAPHPGGYNVLCADGHVLTTRTLPPDIQRIQTALLDPPTPERGSPWEPARRALYADTENPGPEEDSWVPPPTRRMARR